MRVVRTTGRARLSALPGMLLVATLALGACGSATVVESDPASAAESATGASGVASDGGSASALVPGTDAGTAGGSAGSGGCSVAGYDPADPNADPNPTPTCWGGASMGGQGIAVGEPNGSVSSGDLPGAPSVDGPSDDPSGEPKPDVVKPRPGMANVHAVGWEKAEVLGPRTVRIHFWGGVEPCYVLDSVKVSYLAKTVVVTLYSGSDPAHPDTACIDIAKAMAVDVTLSEALAGRDVVAGDAAPAADPTFVDTGDSGDSGQAEAQSDPGGGSGAKVVTPRAGMADVHEQSWDSAKPDGRTVRVFFTSGVEPCYVLDSVKVTYEAKRIVITLYTGRDPKYGPDTACVKLAEYRAVDVKLTEDVGGRPLVDGSAA